MTDLQKVNILVFPDADCERIHALTGPTHWSRHVCAGVPEGGKGQCNVSGFKWTILKGLLYELCCRVILVVL